MGPAGWQGSLYLRPATDVDFRLSSPPPLLGPLSGVSAATIQMPTLSTRTAYAQRCELDLNRDGYVDAERDALTLLRGMLGFGGSALSAGLAHPCVGRTDGTAIAALIAQQSVNGFHDVNGDSRIDAMSDGLVILRYLLGLRGSALTNGVAVNATGQRPTPQAMASYLNGFCGLPL